ncbi:MAG: glyceraldehyde 3-phosphate dehydrogenase NAD-binding domain-containing protein [Candidatus Saelkia tenebricola]|nr:glyceraldehyde 3-phosphate dehydrogenase NAD-binding domain-containing protein [Candidatus Saelkia tenebricola]
MKQLRFLIATLLVVSVFSVSNFNHDLICRRVQTVDFQNQTEALSYIPATSLISAPAILEEPVVVAINVDSEYRLDDVDALIRMLTGNPNVAVAGIYGVDPGILAMHITSNVAHGNLRGMEVEAVEDGILLNGVYVSVEKDPILITDVLGESQGRLVDAIVDFNLGTTYDTNTSLIRTFQDMGGSVIVQPNRTLRTEDNAQLPAFAPGLTSEEDNLSNLTRIPSEIVGIYYAIKTMLESDLAVTSLARVRMISPGGSNQIDLALSRDLGPTVERMFGSNIAQNATMDHVVGAAENGGDHVLMTFEVDGGVTVDDINRAFLVASQSEELGGVLSYADRSDIIASGQFIDIDSGRRFTGPAFVFDSRDTKVANGVVTISGWISDYSVAKAIVNKLISVGQNMTEDERTVLDGTGIRITLPTIPALMREGAKEQCVTEPIRIALNGGGGRIGTAMAVSMIGDPNFNPICFSAVRNVEELVSLLRQDTARGHIYADIQAIRRDGKQYVSINGKEILCIGRSVLSELPWDELGIDVAVDATGAFKVREGKKGLSGHLEAGAQHVGLTVPPSKDPSIPQLVPGVNHGILLDPNVAQDIISFASCTTNNLSTALEVVKRLLAEYGIDVPKAIVVETIHALTKDQLALDGQKTLPVADLADGDPLAKAERGAASSANIISTSTGAGNAAPIVLGWPKEIFIASASRVGNIDGSVTAFEVILPEDCPFTTDDLRAAFQEAADTYMEGIIYFNDSETPLNSRAILMRDHTSTVESSQVEVRGNVISVKTWYDNEWGYTQQVMRGIVMLRLVQENPGITEDELLEMSNRLAVQP